MYIYKDNKAIIKEYKKLLLDLDIELISIASHWGTSKQSVTGAMNTKQLNQNTITRLLQTTNKRFFIGIKKSNLIDNPILLKIDDFNEKEYFILDNSNITIHEQSLKNLVNVAIMNTKTIRKDIAIQLGVSASTFSERMNKKNFSFNDSKIILDLLGYSLVYDFID